MIIQRQKPKYTGCSIKNGHQRNWYFTLAGGINQKSVLPTFFPYIYRYWKIKQLLHLVAFIFSYGLHLIRSKSTDFTNLTYSRYLQHFSSHHWNTCCKNLLRSVPYQSYHYSICIYVKYFSGLRKSLQISQLSQICEICAFASNQLKAIAKIEGHQME